MRKAQIFLRVSFILLALSCLLFAGCSSGDGGGDGGIPVQFRFSGTDAHTAGARIAAQSVISGGINKAEAVDASFTPYNDFYDGASFGTKIADITPTSFKLFIQELTLVGNNTELQMDLMDQYALIYEDVPFIDLVNPQKIALPKIQAGRYDIVLFTFDTSEKRLDDEPGNGIPTEVKFPWPADFTTNKQAWFNANYHTNDSLPDMITMKWDGSSLIRQAKRFEVIPEGHTGLKGIFFGGDAHKIGFQQGYYWDDIVGGYPHEIKPDGNNHRQVVKLFVPFEGVQIPANANAVSIEISWDVENLIEHYSGQNTTPYDQDDKFVFKKGWWNGFKIKVIAE
ncbi:MAG: hypothetical protein LBC67_01975 [Spirochaetales bacterium]|jgi:hypothetical protein|nr:hypothetical protein [Spirochaetales bacterium]